MKTVMVCVWTFMLMAGSFQPALSQTPEGLSERPAPLSTWFTAQAGGAAARSGDEETQLYERGIKPWTSAAGIEHSSCLTMSSS